MTLTRGVVMRVPQRERVLNAAETTAHKVHKGTYVMRIDIINNPIMLEMLNSKN